MTESVTDSPKAIRNSLRRSSSFEAPAPAAQPLEPILFPKLRIYFADFPSVICYSVPFIIYNSADCTLDFSIVICNDRLQLQ